MKALGLILDRATKDRSSPWALATLVRTEGSTYRKPGARILIAPDGNTVGVLSGGCLEELIAKDGLDVMADGSPRTRIIDTQQYFGCEGVLEIFVEFIPPAGTNGNLLTHLAEDIACRRTPFIRTRFRGEHLGSTLETSPALCGDPDSFIQQVPLPIRLLAFGAGPEMEPLSAMANTMGWTLQVFDHPHVCPSDLVGDHLTAALIMNHHFGRDAEAIMQMLPLHLPYVGILGPRRRTNKLLHHLQAAPHLDLSALDAIRSPAGLDIGSESPEEIVLAIVSEILAVLSGHQAGFLCEQNSGTPASAFPGLQAA